MHIQLMTDGGSDIPNALIEKMNIKIVPLYLQFSDGEYKTGVTLTLKDFHEKVNALNEVPKSSAPSPHDFYKAYKEIPKEREIIMISLTKELSSTYENAVLGKNMLLKEEPDRKIAVINSKTASAGSALLLYDLYEKIQEGLAFDELVSHAEEQVEKATTLFILQTLDNAVRGGRVSRVTGKIAQTLNIKPLMRASAQGAIEVTNKVRGEKRAIRRFIEQIGEYTKHPETKNLFMTHCDDEPRAKSLLEKIKEKYSFKETFLSDIGPIIATHGGKGAIVIAFFKD